MQQFTKLPRHLHSSTFLCLRKHGLHSGLTEESIITSALQNYVRKALGHEDIPDDQEALLELFVQRGWSQVKAVTEALERYPEVLQEIEESIDRMSMTPIPIDERIGKLHALLNEFPRAHRDELLHVARVESYEDAIILLLKDSPERREGVEAFLREFVEQLLDLAQKVRLGMLG